jgi:hypothetical protein
MIQRQLKNPEKTPIQRGIVLEFLGSHASKEVYAAPPGMTMNARGPEGLLRGIEPPPSKVAAFFGSPR